LLVNYYHYYPFTFRLLKDFVVISSAWVGHLPFL
jgi:hypothetical protein